MALQHRPNSTDTPVSITRNARHYVSTKREFERQLVGEALGQPTTELRHVYAALPLRLSPLPSPVHGSLPCVLLVPPIDLTRQANLAHDGSVLCIQDSRNLGDVAVLAIQEPHLLYFKKNSYPLCEKSIPTTLSRSPPY